MQLDSANFSESNGRLVMGFSIGSQETREKKKKTHRTCHIENNKTKQHKKKKKEIKIAAPEFRVWSPTTLLGQALTSLTTVDRTGNGAFW